MRRSVVGVVSDADIMLVVMFLLVLFIVVVLLC